jgi:hypothetical protein
MEINIKKYLKFIAVTYIVIGLFVALIDGITSKTIDKIGTQIVKDKIIKIKRAFKDGAGNLYICYSANREKDDVIENWIVINHEEMDIGKGKYIKIKEYNSYIAKCDNSPFATTITLKLHIENIEMNVFDKYFDILRPTVVMNKEMLYVVTDKDLIERLGYVKSDLPNGAIISFEIFLPDVKIKGDIKQILFLPFALVSDVISWPYRLSNMLDSSHQKPQ